MKHRLNTIFKEFNSLAPSNIDHLKLTSTVRTTRNSHPNNLTRTTVNKDCYKYSLYPYTIPEWNLLPSDMKDSDNLDYFKDQLDTIDLIDIAKKAHTEN